MKNKLRLLGIALALLIATPAVRAQVQTFQLSTNAAGVALATSGSNCLVTTLAGTNVCVRLFSTNGTLIGPNIIIGSAQSFPIVTYGAGEYLVYWDDNFIT